MVYEDVRVTYNIQIGRLQPFQRLLHHPLHVLDVIPLIVDTDLAILALWNMKCGEFSRNDHFLPILARSHPFS
jgi:hypothetical protein